MPKFVSLCQNVLKVDPVPKCYKTFFAIIHNICQYWYKVSKYIIVNIGMSSANILMPILIEIMLEMFTRLTIVLKRFFCYNLWKHWHNHIHANIEINFTIFCDSTKDPSLLHDLGPML
jgi:hypothetical protein